jgi:hypothetical protein
MDTEGRQPGLVEHLGHDDDIRVGAPHHINEAAQVDLTLSRKQPGPGFKETTR